MNDSSFGRLVAVLISPTRTFRSIAERPTWLVAILVLILLSAVTASILVPKIDWRGTIDTKLQRADREVAAERLEYVSGLFEEYGAEFALTVNLVMPWIIYPLIAQIFLSVLSRIGGELSFRTSLAVLVHGFMPRAVASLIAIPLALASDGINLYGTGSPTSLAAFAGEQTGLEMWLLLSSIDLFSLWSIALLVTGYSIAAKITRARAAVYVLGLWAAWVAFVVGMAALE